MLASTSAGFILLKPPNDSGLLAIERVKLNSKVLLIRYIHCMITSLDKRLIFFV